MQKKNLMNQTNNKMGVVEEYISKGKAIADHVLLQQDKIEQAAQLFTQSILKGRMVHVFGSGHSRIMVEEMWPRYGSFPGFNPIVELSLSFHNLVIGANGQRQAMFLENVPGQAMVGLLRQIIKNLRQTNDRFIHEVVRKERMTMLSEMAEAILRDFKTSFTIIHMVCTRLRGENKAADLQELCEVVDEQLRVMSEMSEELLTFSRGAVVLARQPVPLSDVFERLAAGLKIILLEQKVRLTVEPSSEVLNADPDRLLRILRALVLKAVENFQGRGGDVTIKTSRDEETFTILIHDDGPVAAPDMNENFFEPLMTRGGMRETGVGVALAKFMVEAHGGRLFIEAKERHGTNFILRFPVDILKT